MDADCLGPVLRFKLAISIVVAAAFVWTFERGGLPLIPDGAALRKVELSTYVEYVALMVTVLSPPAHAWGVVVPPLPSEIGQVIGENEIP